MEEEKHNQEQKAAGWLVTVLTGWGIPGSLARVLAGAIVGALAAWYVVTSTGCSVSYTQLPDGTIQAHGKVVKPALPVTVTK